MEDLELLRAYVHRGDDQSLAELIRRHIGWVYASALRQVRDPHLAEDVAQAVFIALAQKARSLAGGAVIPAWLFKVTRYASARALRTEARRRQHEQRAAAMRSEVPTEDTGPDWQELSPLLDDLVGRLGQKHQHLILLRFYQQKSFAEVAAVLGISEEAARKRAERAVDELREGFARRGVAVGAPAALAGALGLHCAASASAELVSAATAGALAAGKGVLAASGPLILAKGAMATMRRTKAGLAAMVAGGRPYRPDSEMDCSPLIALPAAARNSSHDRAGSTSP